jgi:multiple antibiotic resistance protein
MSMVMDFLLESFITLFIIIDPFVVAPLFMSLTKNDSLQERIHITNRACLISIILLIVFGMIGKQLLELMHVSQASFRIAGGGLLLLASIDMVMAKPSSLQSPTKDETKQVTSKDDICVFPLAIPMIAGPGTLTTMVSLTQRADTYGFGAKMGVFFCTALVIAITYMVMRSSEAIMRRLGHTGINVLARVMGIVLAALSIENIVQGIRMTISMDSH